MIPPVDWTQFTQSLVISIGLLCLIIALPQLVPYYLEGRARRRSRKQ